LQKIILKPIGRVRNSVRRKRREGWESIPSKIVLDPRYEEALEGIEDYSHILVLFWLSRVTPGQRGRMLKIHPRGRLDLPLVGIFSTRTQYRPNPVGLTLVELLKRKKNVLQVRGLDALNGTPVIDIKPISPRTEFPPNSLVPEWYRRLFAKPEKKLPA
jgi:tRNA (adenine37-N6)-methyltransferase